MLRIALQQFMPYLVAAAIAFAGWQWISANGHEAKAILIQSQLSLCQGELAVQTANNSILRTQVEKQNEAIEVAKKEGERRREEALKARDQAMQSLQNTQQEYEALRKNWPQDCVSAVSNIREELGI
jgi:hypothetical protein